MLPAPCRLRTSSEFRDTVRRGTRVARHSLVVHAWIPPEASGSPQVGFVVSKAVGNAVVRNRVKRRLRHLVAERWPHTPPRDGARLVVRALPGAATAGPALASDLQAAWDDAVTRLGARC